MAALKIDDQNPTDQHAKYQAVTTQEVFELMKELALKLMFLKSLSKGWARPRPGKSTDSLCLSDFVTGLEPEIAVKIPSGHTFGLICILICL